MKALNDDILDWACLRALLNQNDQDVLPKGALKKRAEPTSNLERLCMTKLNAW